ncbi:MAG TPA: AraC family transcriptional regulator [Prolixibacteraceae bacterium]|nr:AraC family transcriptional regulator [Prolixibacteraceae bacterium]
MPQSRQLAAIMFTDIVGYTALMGNDEQKAFYLLRKNREFHKPVIDQFGGRLIKELGDGVMASFNTVSDAVNAAIKIMEACNAAKEFQLRIGIHLGEVVFEDDDVFGDGVNIAARIQSVAKPGTICISESVHHNVSNKKEIRTRFVKEETLKNVKEPVKIYEVLMDNDLTSSTEIPDKHVPHNSIAVLPFTNMSSDPEQEFFSDGISEEIINMLAQVQELKVAGRTSSFSFKGKNQDLRIIGEQLNVNLILEGSIRKSGNKLRITAQLIKVADGFHLWSEKFDRELEDIFDIQDEISLAILNAIKIKLFGAEKDAVLKRNTDNPEAFELYLQGRFYFNKWSGASGFNKAIEYYRAAIAIEPAYALAYTGLASCYLNLWFFSHVPPEQSLPELTQAALLSLELDNELAESHLAIARMKMYCDWDLTGAEISYKRALELNPKIAELHEQYGYCLGLSGNFQEAIKFATSAISLDPFSLMNNFHLGSIYWMAGEHEKGIEQGKKLIELEPRFWGGHCVVGANLLALKRYQEALPELELAVKRNYSVFNLYYWGVGLALSGEKEKAIEILEKMEILRSTQSMGNFEIGFVYAALGEPETAFRYFEKAVKNHEGNVLFFKYNIWYYTELEQDPRTKKMFQKTGLPY